MRLDPAVLGRIATDQALWADFERLCDLGGRLAGTEGERTALAFLKARGADATRVQGRTIKVAYGGWTARRSELRLADGTIAPCNPLVRSVATAPGGLDGEVVDLGRGTPEEFAAHAGELRGRIALVRHELMFAAGTIHRRRKYQMACEAGAAGFLVAGPLPGAVVAGSSGRTGEDGIPAAGIAPETAARLRRTADGWPRVRLTIETSEGLAESETLIFQVAGKTDDWVLLSAHVDGHDLAESAMDNASGVAAVLSIARALAPRVKGFRRGLRICFFSVEEWALTGSAQYVEALTARERDGIALNVNLDCIAGASDLAALTSGFAAIEPFVLAVAAANGQTLRTVRPLMVNSDHGNFALAGIPALRLVAGFDNQTANVRHVLTSADTRDKVLHSELRQATLLAAAITAAACQASPEEVMQWRGARC